MKKHLCLYAMIFLFLGDAFNAKAQLVTTDGVDVIINPGAVVWINGDLSINNSTLSAASFTNNGDSLTTATNSLFGINVNPGDLKIGSGAVVNGNGLYKVEGDWINNGNFLANNSEVELYSDASQNIGGLASTTFHNLTLTGNGTGANRVKRQLIDVNVDVTGKLDIKDRELATDNFTIWVQNPLPASISNTTTFGVEGFISSTNSGSLRRETNSTSAYVFPTGSSNGTLRYRAIELKPTNSASNSFEVQLVNYLATNDGASIDSIDNNLICSLNSQFYHKIRRPAGSSSADLNMFYDDAADGGFDGMANWNQPMAGRWNAIANTTANPGSYSKITRQAWSNFSEQNYILGRIRPGQPAAIAEKVCEGSSGYIAVSPSNANMIYAWTTTDGTIASFYNDSVIVNWLGSNPSFTLTQQSFPGCVSIAVTNPVILFANPVAGFDTSMLDVFGAQYNFVDTSTETPTIWQWNFGDNSDLGSVNNITHTFSSPGEYVVTLTATTANGCTSDARKTINVSEGIKIPNVFSPNDDGLNESFYIASNGVKSFHIKVFNRWGTLVFESEAPLIIWDGTTVGGVEASAGTYFFMLDYVLESGKQDHLNSFLTLLR